RNDAAFIWKNKKWKSYFNIYSTSQCLITGSLHGDLRHEDYHFLHGIRFSRLQIPAICGIHYLIGLAATSGLAGQGIGRISLSKSVPGLRSLPALSIRSRCTGASCQ
ncbi:TPA: hypothetical protein ACWV6G_005441, partial [Salmonella enterica subsp. enterica serovar Muenchen]